MGKGQSNNQSEEPLSTFILPEDLTWGLLLFHHESLSEGALRDAVILFDGFFEEWRRDVAGLSV